MALSIIDNKGTARYSQSGISTSGGDRDSSKGGIPTKKREGRHPGDIIGAYHDAEAQMKKEQEASEDYGIVMLQVMMQQMQQNFMSMMQQMQAQTEVPQFEPPPLMRPRKQLDIEAERAKIRDRLAKERDERQSDLRTLSSTLRTSLSLLSKDPSVVSGESLIKTPEGEE